MDQEKFSYQKEINLKLFSIILILITFNISSEEILKSFNTMLQSDLSFKQEIEKNINDKSYSAGYIERKGDSIEINIKEPFREKYLINDEELVVYDFEFDQTQIMTITKNEAPLINLLKSGVILEQTQELTDKSFVIAINDELLYIELISDKSFYVSYKDNMSYKNIVTFTTITNL